MHTHATTDSPKSSHDHGDPLKTYIAVFASLMVLLFLTVGAYFIDFERFHVGEHSLGWVNTCIALCIAGVKTSLVVLFFMHLRHSTRLTWIVAAAGFIFLCIMVLFTFSDYLSRNAVSESVREAQVDTQTTTHANGQALLQDIPNQVSTPGW
jgi:cytochrome c oxidase subunit 4